MIREGIQAVIAGQNLTEAEAIRMGDAVREAIVEVTQA